MHGSDDLQNTFEIPHFLGIQLELSKLLQNARLTLPSNQQLASFDSDGFRLEKAAQ